MKNYLFPVLLMFGFIVACTQSGQGLAEGNKHQLVLKPFSDTALADTFKVALIGETPADLLIRFSITAHNGKLIYHKDIKSGELIDNYKESIELKKQRDQMAFILNEYQLFLDDENFLEPAVTENENPDQYTPDKKFYEELRQSGLNGFKYRTGKENNTYIAWSEKEKKVKTYYNCCK